MFQDLFNRIGPVSNLELLYDRAGRSNGTAFVTYEDVADAKAAIREFDGANANGENGTTGVAGLTNRDRSTHSFDRNAASTFPQWAPPQPIR